MSKHEPHPLPWRTIEDEHHHAAIVDAKGEEVADLGRFWGVAEHDQPLIDLGARIVKSVASHAALIAALEGLLRSAPSGDDLRLMLIGVDGVAMTTEKGAPLRKQCDDLTEAHAAARAALAKAKEGV